MDDTISRRGAIERVLAGKLSDDSLVECVEECNSMLEWAADVLKNMPPAEPGRLTDEDFETIRIHLNAYKGQLCNQHRWEEAEEYQRIIDRFISFASAQPDENKYEYHYDHTDCIWYRPEARNRCPATCAQYRDGWNDAMNYIFRDGKGYRPYRRDKQYGE